MIYLITLSLGGGLGLNRWQATVWLGDDKVFWHKYVSPDIRELDDSNKLCFSFFFNPLLVIFFRENINIYLHFMSFLQINKTQVVEIPPRVRQGPAYST